MYTLFLTDKNDLDFKQDYRVFHLRRGTVSLSPPESYGYLSEDEYFAEENKVQAYEELPILPETLKLRVEDEYKDDIEQIKALGQDAKEVVILSADTEYLLSARLVLLRAGIKKPVFYSPDGVKMLRYEEADKGVTKLFNLQKADWYFDATINRLISLKLNKRIHLSILSAVLFTKAAAGGCTDVTLQGSLKDYEESAVSAALSSLRAQKLLAYKRGRGAGGEIVLTDLGYRLMQLLPDGAFDEGVLKIAGNLTIYRTYLLGIYPRIKDIPSGITFTGSRPVYAKCPWCGGPVIRVPTENAIHYSCGNNDCSYDVATDAPEVLVRTGDYLTEEQCLEIVRNGKISLPCRKKAGSAIYYVTFSAGRTADEDGHTYATIKSGLVRPAKKKGDDA